MNLRGKKLKNCRVATRFCNCYKYFAYLFLINKNTLKTPYIWSRPSREKVNNDLAAAILKIFTLGFWLKKKKKKKKRLVWFGSPTFSTSSAPVWYGSKSTDSYCSCFTRITQAYSSQVRASDDTLYNKIKWQAAFGMVDPNETWP